MPRKRTGYDAACYYDGKLLGRCTKADSDAYTLLMNACGGDAARVLREYAYFSPELRAILEKVVLRELLDKKLWKIPDRIKDKGQFEEKLNQSIRQYHPEYWRARQSGRKAAEAARSTAPAKEAAR